MSTKLQNRVAALLRAVFVFETTVLVAAFAILIGVTFADVISRRITGSGILWSRDVGIYANVWLSMIGIGIASAQGSHLRPRFLDRAIRPVWEPGMQRLQELLTAVGFVVLAWIAWQVVAETRELDDRNMVLRWPVWLLQLCMPVAFGFAASKHLAFAAYPSLRPGERDEVTVQPGP